MELYGTEECGIGSIKQLLFFVRVATSIFVVSVISGIIVVDLLL